MSLSKGVKTGRLEGLKALRDRIVQEIDSGAARPSDVASLAGRLTVVLEQIEALEKAQQVRNDSIDEIASKRAARRAATKGAGAAGRRRVDRGAGGG
jgi:hypothetical protein